MAGYQVRLYDEGSDQGLPRRAGGVSRHHAGFPAWREDRRAWRERRRQIDADADHGRPGHRFRRRGVGGRGGARRLPVAGAAARSGQDGGRECRAGVRRAEGGDGSVQRNFHEIRRADERRGDEHAARRAGRPAGEDRRGGRLGPGSAGGDRAGRAALSAGGCAGGDAVGRRAAAGGAVPAAAGKARPAAARRTDQPPGRRKRRLAGADAARIYGYRYDRDPRPLLPRQRHRLDSGDRAGPGLSVRGQLFVVAGAEAQAPGAGGEGGECPAAGAGRRAGMDRRLAARAAGEESRPHPALRGNAGADRRNRPAAWRTS